MKALIPVQSGMFKGALADVFMNLSLVIVWLLFMNPSQPPVDTIPDQSIPPTDENSGDRPASGQQIARISLQTSGDLIIETQGEKLTYEQYQTLLINDPEMFPDHLVFSFPDFQQLQLIGDAALQRDASVSIIELNR